MKSPVKFAVVGLGHIGKRHANVVKNNPRASLEALVEIDTAKHNALAEEFKIPIFTSLTDMFSNHTDIEVVNICTPNGLHAEQAILCLNHHKHVVCEKPMAINQMEAKAMIKASEQMQKKIFCVMQNRYSPTAVWLKDIVTNNLLGKIIQVNVQCYWNRDQRYYQSAKWRGTTKLDGGVLYTQFSHYIDTLYWLFGGNIKVKYAQVHNTSHPAIEIEDNGNTIFEFENGAICNFSFSTTCWDKNFISSINIVGEKGSLRVGGQYMNEVEYCHIQNYQMPNLAPTLPANDYGFYKGSASNHELVIENVINHLEKNTPITATALDGIKVVEMIEQIYAFTKNQQQLNLKKIMQ